MSVESAVSSRLVVRLGNPYDDQQIRALMTRNPMPGAVSVAFSTEPSFFDAVEVEGCNPKVIVGEADGCIVGMGLTTSKYVYLNGLPAKVGYLSSLRIDATARNSTGLARGFRLLKELHRIDSDAPRIYLTSILEENSLARSILTSGRGGLPHYDQFTSYDTVVIPVLPRRAPHIGCGLELVSGGDIGPEAIVEFLNEIGRTRQFYPVYSVSDIVEPSGLLRGLSVHDFIVARRGRAIVGVMAAWDQRAFRQNVVVGYSRLMGSLRKCLGVLRRVMPLPALPNPGAAIESVLTACVAVRDDDRRIFELMLGQMLYDLSIAGKSFLMLGFAENDPLAAVAKSYIHYALRSRIYTASWDDGQDEVNMLNRSLVPYLELGSL